MILTLVKEGKKSQETKIAKGFTTPFGSVSFLMAFPCYWGPFFRAPPLHPPVSGLHHAGHQQVGRVHGTVRLPGADEQMRLVDEEHHPSFRVLNQ